MSIERWAFLVFLIAPYVLVSACPKQCNCHPDMTNCRNVSLASIPDDLDATSETVDISYNNITVLYNEDFQGVTAVNVLFLNDNGISQIQSHCFYWVQGLTQLHLQNNRISSVHPDTFKFLVNLRYLSLRRNELQTLKPITFENNAKLIMLDLSENKIKFLEPNTFKKNPILSWVNVRANNLQYSTELKNILQNALNVINADFCADEIEVFEFRRIPKLEKLISSQGVMMHLDDFTSFTNSELSNSEIVLLKYRVFHEFYEMEYGSVTFLTGLEDGSVAALTGEKILCYCEQMSLWFFCYENTIACKNSMAHSDIYSRLKCFNSSSEVVSNSSDVEDSKFQTGVKHIQRIMLSHSVSGDTIKKTLMYGSVPGCLVIMVIVAYIWKKVQEKRKSREQNQSSYEELRTMSFNT